LILATPIFIFTQIEQVPIIENLRSVIHNVFMDEMSKNVTIDSLNNTMIEKAIWDTLITMGVDTINVESIVQLDIDFTIRDSSSLDVTIHIVYDSSGITQQVVDPFIRDRQNIVLSTTYSRLMRSFTINIDNNLLVAEAEVQTDFGTTEIAELIEETAGRRPGIFLVVENGVHLGYSYQDIAARAFENRRLTDVDLPNGIQTIGSRAFANNRLTVINIPHTVTTIEAGAFVNNRPEMVSIGEDVKLGRNAIGRDFETFYNRNGKKAGIYIFERNRWSLAHHIILNVGE
jgi:hypothetical protein